jgi:pyruvate/2-oxoglutarate dehydrogenase complex dihydrolipoamide dehydrogenase (E3) component
MAQPERYEDLVLGSGAGGKRLAWHLARSGRRTAVVERRWIGGSCPNIACLPSKNEIWSAKVAALLHHGAQFGAGPGGFTADMAKVWQRKRDMVDRLVDMHLDHYKTSGAQLIMGTGLFVAGERTVSGSDILAATGRTANAAGIGLEVAGVELDARGYVKVNDRLETGAPDVWATGECASSPQFTHVSVDDFRVIWTTSPAGPQHPRPPRPLLPVYGSAAGAGRPQRAGSPARENRGARGTPADEGRVADVDHR